MFRAFLRRHPRATDLGVAVIVLALSYVETNQVGLRASALDQLGGAWFLVNVLSAATLLARRARPLSTFVVIAAAGIFLTAVGHPPLIVPLTAAVYALAVYRGARSAWICTGVLSALLVLLDFALRDVSTSHTDVLLVAAMIIAALVGVNVGSRKRYLDALLERAAQLARERDQNAQLATAAERARIARELHDVVAHSLSVVVRLADGSEAVADADPPRSRKAVQQIGEVGRTALTDMRRLLGVLREGDEAALAPQPTLDDLDRLVTTFRSAGLPVAVRRTGDTVPEGPLGGVVYRAIQESLTNALRYAVEPTRVLVALDLGPTVLDLEVADDGIARAASASVGAERGLIGLRERAALYGGSVEAGPRTDAVSGWRVHVVVPMPRDGADDLSGDRA